MSLDRVYAETLFNYLYSGIDGYQISRDARIRAKFNTDSLLYGELSFGAWEKIVMRANPKKDGVFFDLGSGTGRVVFASYLNFNFVKTIGIELLEGLHNKACAVKDTFEKNIKNQILSQINGREINFFLQDIFAANLREADFIFMNHPFKEGDDFLKLEEKLLQELRPKSKIVTTIRPLKNSAFKNLGSEKFEFSWGKSEAYFFET